MLKPAPKLTPELLNIDWTDTTKHIRNLIRGLSPYPAAYTMIQKDGQAPVQLKIFRADAVEGNATPGTIDSDGKTYLTIAAADGLLSIKELQLSGKKKMNIEEFLRGFREPQSWIALNGSSKSEIARLKEK